MADEDEPTIIYSPLRQRIEGDGTYLEVEIYRGEHDEEPGWLLEVVDEEGASTIYDDRFASDEQALNEVLATIKKHGIRAYVEDRLADGDEASGTVH